MMQPFLHALKFHIKTTLCFGVLGAIIQPDYYRCYSFRRNCFNGFELGIMVGWNWPIAIPLIAYRVIRQEIDSDPVLQDWRDVSLDEKKRMGLFKDKEEKK